MTNINESLLFVFYRAQKQIHGKQKENVLNILIKLMANRTSWLFAQVDLFSRSHMTAFYLQRRHWK